MVNLYNIVLNIKKNWMSIVTKYSAIYTNNNSGVFILFKGHYCCEAAANRR